MENVYQEKSRFRMTKRKALVIGFAILATGIVLAEPIYASVPWYITAIGAVAGGIVGSLTGSPIGTIAGATAGALLADYLYSITHKDASMPNYFPNQQKLENEFGASYQNLTNQELIDAANSGQTEMQLFTEDYYYNAQQQEAIAPYFLANSSLNEFNISLASGTYATLNNVSDSTLSPIDTILYQTWFTGWASSNNGFTENQTGQSWTYRFNSGGNYGVEMSESMPTYSFEGINLTSNNGNYMFIEPQNLSTSIFKAYIGLSYLNITNFFTGKTYNVSSKGVVGLNTSKIPYGLYKINSNKDVYTTGIVINPSGTLVVPSNIMTTYIFSYSSTTATYTLINAYFANTSLFSNFILFFAGSLVGSTYSGQSNGGTFYPKGAMFTTTENYYTTLSSDLQNIYSSAESYFSTLKSLGYTNINQIPPNEIIPFPSNVVPSSMLNGTFSYQELLEMYISYLNDLNTTFHNSTLFNGKNFTKFVNQTLFVNGFLTEYGDLTYTVGTTNHYLNNTDFFIQTYTHKLFFAKGHTTNLTGEIYPVLVLNGTQNGSLLYVDASIYVINLQLAGKNISSYTLEPEQITYVLPNTTNIGVPNTSGFLTSTSNFLEKYYLILTVIITIAVIGYVYTRKQKGSGKE